jgi:hypothetical protein
MIALKSGSIELIVKEQLIYGNQLPMEWNEHVSLYVFFQINILKVNHVEKNLSMLLILSREELYLYY